MSDNRELKKIISKENKVLKGSAFLTDDINKKKIGKATCLKIWTKIWLL